MVEKFMQWLAVSSADPQKTALTLKGMFLHWVALVLFVLQYVHIGHLNISGDTLNSAAADLSALIGSLLFSYGLVRKIYFTFFPKVVLQ